MNSRTPPCHHRGQHRERDELLVDETAKATKHIEARMFRHRFCKEISNVVLGANVSWQKLQILYVPSSLEVSCRDVAIPERRGGVVRDDVRRCIVIREGHRRQVVRLWFRLKAVVMVVLAERRSEVGIVGRFWSFELRDVL